MILKGLLRRKLLAMTSLLPLTVKLKGIGIRNQRITNKGYRTRNFMGSLSIIPNLGEPRHIGKKQEIHDEGTIIRKLIW
jgi:hypothetical protein